MCKSVLTLETRFDTRICPCPTRGACLCNSTQTNPLPSWCPNSWALRQPLPAACTSLLAVPLFRQQRALQSHKSSSSAKLPGSQRQGQGSTKEERTPDWLREVKFFPRCLKKAAMLMASATQVTPEENSLAYNSQPAWGAGFSIQGPTQVLWGLSLYNLGTLF